MYYVHVVLQGSKDLTYGPLIFNSLVANIIDVVWETETRKSAEQHNLGVLSFLPQQATQCNV